MGQAGAEVVARSVEENLGLIFEAPEGAGMDNPRPVALKLCPKSVARLVVPPAARFAGLLRERREDAALVGFHFFARLPAIARNNLRRPVRRHTTIIRGSPLFASPDSPSACTADLEISTLRATLARFACAEDRQ